jgi:uncharacterized peroxidase-related enzyme
LTAAGHAAGEQEELLQILREENFDGTRLGNVERVMLEYADKLTRTPAAIGSTDVARLRSVGFDDRAIHDICAIVAYFAFVNRIADGLGVELEGYVDR